MKPLVRISFCAPVLVDVWAYKLRLSIHRRGQPWLCLSWATTFPQGGGDLPQWAAWCFWVNRGTPRFFRNANAHPHGRAPARTVQGVVGSLDSET